MNRRLVTAVAVVAAGGLALAPAHAATRKKPKPVTGHYSVTLPPDPSADAFSGTGQKDPVDGECGLSGSSESRHALTIPGRGTLHVVLDAPNPLPVSTAVGPDWDLHILDSDGSDLDASTSPTSHEETTDKFKAKQSLTILVCNITGGPTANVSYTFTYA